MAGIGLGIDLGARTIKVVRVRSTDAGVVVLSAAKVERPLSKEESPVEAPDGAGARLARAGVSGGGVVGASGRDVMLRYVVVPPAPPWRLRKIIDFELRGKAASPEELDTDYRVLALPGGLRKEMVTLAAVGKDGYLTSLFSAVRRLGLKVRWACPPSVALYRAFLRSHEYRDKETTFLMDVGHEKLELAIQRDGQLIFARSSPGGGKRFTRAIDGVFKMGLERAEAFKHERARLSARMPPDAPQQSLVLNSALAEAADQIVGAVSGAMRFCSMQAKIPKLDYERLIVSGSGARLGGLKEYLQAKLGKPVVFFDPTQAADTSRLRSEEAALFSSPPGEMSIAYGLALCSAEEGFSLSLLPAAEEKRRAFWARDAFGWGAACCALLIAAFLAAGSVRGLNAAGEDNRGLKRVRGQFEIEGRQVEKRVESIASLAAEARLVSEVTSPGTWLVKFLSHQRKVTPEGVSLTKLDFERDDEGVYRIRVEGVAEKAKIENVFEALGAYMEELKECPSVVEASAQTGREGEEVVPFSYEVVLGEKVATDGRGQVEQLSKESARQIEVGQRAVESRTRGERGSSGEEVADPIAKEEREAEEKRLASERRKREESYQQYLKKSQAFYDSLYRTNSDLQVGINYTTFQERVRDMNYQYNKWAESLTSEEKKNPSARLMEAALRCYILSQKHWQKKVDIRDSLLPETLMQHEWRKATALLSRAKECRQKNDVVRKQRCISCEGRGKLPCPVCRGTGRLPLDGGTCLHCLRAGEKEDCPECAGTGFFPPSQ